MTLCKICKTKLKGRSDKIFCSIRCKSYYHQKLSSVTNDATQRIDKILHRNRSILLEIMGKNKHQIQIDKIVLDRKKLNYTYVTGYYLNSKNKIYNYVYDFAWMIFGTNKIHVYRRK